MDKNIHTYESELKLKQFDTLRREFFVRLEHNHKITIFSITSTGAILLFVFSKSNNLLFAISASFLNVFLVFFLERSWYKNKDFSRLAANFIRKKIEPNNDFWEKYLEQLGTQKRSSAKIPNIFKYEQLVSFLAPSAFIFSHNPSKEKKILFLYILGAIIGGVGIILYYFFRSKTSIK